MHFLGREPAGSRLLVLATIRAENDAQVGAALAPVARRVEVGPLGPAAARQLAGAAGQGELADPIPERTPGHTLFGAEVLRALTIGAAGVPESLAGHAAAAGDWLRAARAWLRAGDEAMARYATSDAAVLATQALEAAERVPDAEVSARALVLRGRTHHALGDNVAALADLTRGANIARAIGDRRLEMLALYELGGDVPVLPGLPLSYYASNLESGLRIAESLGDRASEANLLAPLALTPANRPPPAPPPNY